MVNKNVSFLQNYLVFFLLGIIYFFLYFIIFLKFNLPYHSNYTHTASALVNSLLLIPCVVLFSELIKNENINHNYASTLFYFGYLLSSVYCWRISTVFLPLDVANRACGECWWRIVPVLESYTLLLYNMLYDI